MPDFTAAVVFMGGAGIYDSRAVSSNDRCPAPIPQEHVLERIAILEAARMATGRSDRKRTVGGQND